jgi:hypothetical protein
MTLGDLLTFLAAIPAGIAGVIIGDRLCGWLINRARG